LQKNHSYNTAIEEEREHKTTLRIGGVIVEVVAYKTRNLFLLLSRL